MTQRPQSSWVVACLAIALAEPALAQTPQEDARREYNRQQEEQRMEQQRRAQEEFNQRQKGTEEENKRFTESMRGITTLKDPPPPPSGSPSPMAATALKARKDLEAQPPLPPQKNPLLGGQWTRERKARPAASLAGLEALITGGACEMWLGDGTIEFRPDRMVGHDKGIGATDMGEVSYRGGKDFVAVLPKAKGVTLLWYQLKGPDRIEDLYMKDCTLVRVGASATARGAAPGAAAAAAAAAASSTPRVGSAGGASALASPASAAIASSAPPAPTFDRSVCRQTMLDRIGNARVDEVKAALAARFRETLTGTVPNAGTLRLDARGSPCDDPRLNATLYDFDSAGVLQVVTLVWARPAGPAPAPIFSERVSSLARFHALPAPQSAARLQADISLGRLILQDMPERNLLLEAYKARN